MPKQLAVLKKMRAKVRKYIDTLDHYEKLFKKDGEINKDEAKQLKKIRDLINQLETTISSKEKKLGPMDGMFNTISAVNEDLQDKFYTNDDEPDHSLVNLKDNKSAENTNSGTASTSPKSEEKEKEGKQEKSPEDKLVNNIPTTGRKGSVAKSKASAKSSEPYLKEKAGVIKAAAEKHNLSENLLSAIISRESDGKSALKSLTYFKTTPAKQLARIKKNIIAKLGGYNFQSKQDFLKSKYNKFKASDLPGLNANDKVWGDHGNGFGITQFDIRWHATKVLDMLSQTKEEAENTLIGNAGALIAEEVEKAKKAHSDWSEAECLQAAVAAYNAGSTIHDGKGKYPKMKKFDPKLLDARTTGHDYSNDVVARAQYYSGSESTQEGGSKTTGEDDGKATNSSSGTIQQSVGKGGANQKGDVEIVQALLIKNGAKIKPDGDCGSRTIGAIRKFQSANFSWKPDGLISVGGNTWKALSTGKAEGQSATSTDQNASTDGNTSSDEKEKTYTGAETWDSHTNKRIKTLDSRVKGAAFQFVNKVQAELGIKLRVTSGFRSLKEQDALFKKGNVTKARGGQSYHNYGLAIDVVEIKNGKAIWNGDWAGISRIGKSVGFEWGGDWKSFTDKPHFQMTFGKKVRELCIQKYPKRAKRLGYK